jgi:hypothetical protein
MMLPDITEMYKPAIVDTCNLLFRIRILTINRTPHTIQAQEMCARFFRNRSSYYFRENNKFHHDHPGRVLP